MSINVYKNILVIKSHSVIELFLTVSLKLWGLGLRWYFVSMVPGSVECKTCCLLYVTLVNNMRLFRVAYSCPICASITRKYTTYLIVAGEVPGDGRSNRSIHKNCEDQASSSGDIFSDRQTRKQRDRETRSSQYSASLSSEE